MGPAIIEQVLLALAMLCLMGLLFYWGYVGKLAKDRWRSMAGGTLNDGELGLAEIRLPSGWRGTTVTGSEAPIQVTDRLRRRFLVINSESRDDFVGDMDLEEFHRLFVAQLSASARILEFQEPQKCHVGGFEALQSEIVIIEGDRWITKYLITAVAGARGFHKVLAWSAPSTYDRALFGQLLDNFRERPGPPPSTRYLPPPEASSSKTVH